MHLILSHAASHRWPDAPPGTLALPQLQRLLARMRRVQALDEPPWERPHPLMPHERALTQALGWPDAGPWPLAARDTGSAGAQAWVTPCHWQVGMDQVVMLAPEALQLDEAESRQLLQAMQPYMAEDGLQLQWHHPLRWLARGEVLTSVATASLARVSGTNVRPWVTDGSLPAPLRRLQSEMQMLLYHHPVNDQRAARGLPIVNSFWLYGAGDIARTDNRPTGDANAHVCCIDTLESPARQQDFGAWQTAWQALDREVLGPLAAVDTPLTLTLCSETSAHTWRTAPLSWRERMQRRLRPPSTGAVLQALLQPSESP